MHTCIARCGHVHMGMWHVNTHMYVLVYQILHSIYDNQNEFGCKTEIETAQ